MQETRERLDGWKGIAAYLGRDVTTVIRWERQRGLPVHRVPGEQRRAVYAYPVEIDRWLAAPGAVDVPAAAPAAAEAAPPATPSGGSFRPTSASPAPRRRRWRAVVTGAAVLALAGATVAWRAVSRVRAAPVRAEVRPEGVVAWGADGRLLWTHAFERPTVASPWAQSNTAAVVDLDGDGRAEVVATADVSPLRDGQGRGELVCLSADGTLLWRRVLEDEVVFRGATFGPPWQGGKLAVYRADGRALVAWSQLNAPSWASIVSVLDATGRRVGRFVHSGSTYALNVFEGPSGPLVVAGGVSNSQRAAAAYVLDGRDVRGHSVEPPGSPFECLDCEPGEPLRYFVFPPTEVVAALGRPYNHVAVIADVGRAVRVATEEGQPSTDGGIGTVQQWFQFDGELRLRSAQHSDSWPMHDKLQKAGRLDHPASDCPMYRTSPVVREGDPVHGWRTLRLEAPARSGP